MRIEISDETVRLVKKAVAIIEEVPWEQRDYDPATAALVAIGNAIARGDHSDGSTDA